MTEEENLKPRSKRELEEDHTPLWIKMFGGTILSIAFLLAMTLAGYIVSNIYNLQTQINCINVDFLTKKEYADRQKAMSDLMKIDSDNILSLKERLSFLENTSKDRQIWIEKYEVKTIEQNKSIENVNQEIASNKERSNGLENQLKQLREENQQLQKDMQLLREKVAVIEGKTGVAKSGSKDLSY